MATINEITSAAGYKGDAALGGYIPDAIVIDTKPLETLAKYTIDFNKAEYRQRQLDAEAKAVDLAEVAAFDFSQIDEQWRKPIAEKFNALTTYVRQNPDVFNYQKNPEKYLEYKRLKNETAQAVKNGGANQILLEGRKEAVAKETDLDIRSIRQKRLDGDKVKTGLDAKLPIEDSNDIAFPKLGDPAKTKFDVYAIDANNTIYEKHIA